MKVNFNQNTQSQKVEFKSLKGELPTELARFQKGFSEYVESFMQNKPAYDIVLLTSKNKKNLKIKGSTGFTFLEKAQNKKAISKITSLEDLKEMIKDNYLTIQAGQDTLEEIGKVGKCLSIN